MGGISMVHDVFYLGWIESELTCILGGSRAAYITDITEMLNEVFQLATHAFL